MSKFMVASDIHGSFTGVGTLLERFSDEKADRLILLGDLYYHGPRNPLPAEYDAQKTADLLNSVKENLIVVRGNCDADVDLCISDFTFSDHYIIPAFGKNLFFTHGHIYSPYRLPPLLKKGDIFFSGHTHIPMLRNEDGIFLVNPGSIGLPKGGSQKSYISVCDDGITLKALSGDTIASLDFN